MFGGVRETWLILPEGNGKTTFLAALGLYHGDYMPSAMVPIAASSREQAEILYRQAEGFVLRTRGLRDRFKTQPGYRRIHCLRTGGRLQVYAAEARTGDGIIPTLALIDELHRHRDLQLYRTWQGKLDKRGGQLVTISTAGEPGSEFEDTRGLIRKSAEDVVRDGCHVRAAGEDIVLHDFAVPSREQSDDMEIVARANPRRAITAETLRKKRDSPTMTDEHWLRFVCNIATQTDGDGIPPELWAAGEVEGLVAPPTIPWYIGLDLGWKIDHAGITPLGWKNAEERIVHGAVTLAPPVREDDIVDALIDLHLSRNVAAVVYDPNAGGQQMAQLLERGQHPRQLERKAPPMRFIEHSQDNAPMALAATRFDEAIRSGWLQHDDPRDCATDGCACGGLRGHVLNAVRHSIGTEKWRFDRPSNARGDRRRKYPIDGLTGLLIAHSTAVTLAGRERPRFEVIV